MKDPELLFRRLKRDVNDMANYVNGLAPRTERELRYAMLLIRQKAKKIERMVK